MALVPIDAGLLEYEGKLLGDLKRYPESYAAFERALQMQPTRVSVYARRADVEIADGRASDAIRDLEHHPADGIETTQVHAKLDMLRAQSASEIVAASATAAQTLAKSTAAPLGSPDGTASAGGIGSSGAEGRECIV